MSKINANKSTTFAAVKLIEELFRNGKIPQNVLRNILDEYADVVDTTKFNCNNTMAQKAEETKCTT